jgi:AcrR family transcriptional regulator
MPRKLKALAIAVKQNFRYDARMQPGAEEVSVGPGDRRARRRRETIEEILDIAEAVMDEEGVGGLSLSEVARRLGVKPPSIYKYFDSLMAIYDALFERGQRANLEVMRGAMAEADPGLPAIAAGLDASGRWCMAHPAIAQLLWWRPVPGFEPTPEALAPSIEMVALQRQAFADAVAAGQLAPGADPEELVWLSGTLISGVLGMSLANEPGQRWGKGRFTPLLPKLLDLLPALYPPKGSGRRP